jgi:DNA-binding MarR family transcriptional regulator
MKETLHMALIKFSKSHIRKAQMEFNKVGLTQGQPKILDFLVENDGCIQREIAESCEIEPATVTSLLANMEKCELIYRSENPKNRRILNVFLTDKGKMAQKEVRKIFKSMDDECFEGFSDEEKLQAINFLNRMRENLLRGEKDND